MQPTTKLPPSLFVHAYVKAYLAFIFFALPVPSQSVSFVPSVNPIEVRVASGGDSTTPVMTADGQYVLFSSAAENLVSLSMKPTLPARVPRPSNVYLRNRPKGSTSLISVDMSGTICNDAPSFSRGISENGRFVLFESNATNIVLGDTNQASDIFVRDVISGKMILVSMNINGVPGNGPSKDSVITPDGRFVAFTSSASDLVANDTNNLQDVFVRDLRTGITRIVSVGATSTIKEFPTGNSDGPVITPDGRFVAFSSSATNLVSDVCTKPEIYLRDLLLETTICVSIDAHAYLCSTAGTTNSFVFNQAISPDGRFVIYEICKDLIVTWRAESVTNTTTAGLLLRYDASKKISRVLHTNTASSAIANGALTTTPDGNKVAFVANALDSSGLTTCILVWDAARDTTALVSGDMTNGVPRGSQATAPVIDATGRYVTFMSSAPGLVTNELVGSFHLYVRDLETSTTSLVDVGLSGVGSGVDVASSACISRGGDTIIYTAPDGLLVNQDRNNCHDIFARNLVNHTTEVISAPDPERLNSCANNPSSFTYNSVNKDGTLIVFQTLASDVLVDDTNSNFKVFLQDTQLKTNFLISINTNGASTKENSFEPTISQDGRFVAFTSYGNDLARASSFPVPIPNVFIRDRQKATTRLVRANNQFSTGSRSPTINANGRFVLFQNINGSSLCLFDLENNRNFQLTTPVYSSSMTPDGHYVVSSTTPSPPSTSPSQPRIINYLNIWDSLATRTVYFLTNTYGFGKVAISPDGQCIVYEEYLDYGKSFQLMALDRMTREKLRIVPYKLASQPGLRFSADGRFLTFSAMPVLTSQVFLYDSEAKTNVLLTKGFGGEDRQMASGNSDSPDISANGRFIAFRSDASNLVIGDDNGVSDIFLFDRQNGGTILLTGSRFGNRSADNRSANPVFSGDGSILFFESWASDLVEATPANRGSIFSYKIFSGSEIPLFSARAQPGTDGVWITWPVVPGNIYTVEFKAIITENWQLCAEDVSIVGNQGFLRTSGVGEQRYFRVVARSAVSDNYSSRQ